MGRRQYHIKTISNYPIESTQTSKKDCVILTLNKTTHLKMSHIENDFDINYSISNANTLRQKNEIGAIIKKVKLLEGN